MKTTYCLLPMKLQRGMDVLERCLLLIIVIQVLISCAFMHSHTYSGNPLGCAAALAVLQIFKEEDILEKANENAKYFNKAVLEELGDYESVGEIRSIGLINAIEIVKDKSTKEAFDPKLRIGHEIFKMALKEGLILRPLGDVMYFNPPLTISRNEMDQVIERASKAIRKIV